MTENPSLNHCPACGAPLETTRACPWCAQPYPPGLVNISPAATIADSLAQVEVLNEPFHETPAPIEDDFDWQSAAQVVRSGTSVVRSGISGVLTSLLAGCLTFVLSFVACGALFWFLSSRWLDSVPWVAVVLLALGSALLLGLAAALIFGLTRLFRR